MRILALSDTESPALWDFFKPERLKGIDVIISCGDLDPHYLSFLATFFHGPVLYVHGNHDACYENTPPEGCICIEDRVYVYRGVRFLGLGGSMRYKPGPHQYTEKQMRLRILRLWFQLLRRRGFDVLVTHAPLRGCGDLSDLPHRGFAAFRDLLDAYAPPLMLHGHVHLSYGANVPREHLYGKTRIVNGFERYVVELNLPSDRRPPTFWQRLLGRPHRIIR